jgi:signal transduction histidine kinase
MFAIGAEMEQLIEALLLISRGDEPSIRRTGPPRPLAAIIGAEIERARDATADRKIAVSVNIAEDCAFHASSDALAIIVRNLIDNAVRYSPEGGSIAVTAHSNGSASSCALVIENGPVELREEDLLRLFEPFWRADGSRADRTHFGLGLTVVQRVAEAAGLRVEAKLNEARLQIEVAEQTRGAVAAAGKE